MKFLNLKIEKKKLLRLIQKNPLRTDFRESYEKIIAGHNKEKDRHNIEATFEALPISDIVKRVTRETANQRNHFMAKLADEKFVAYAATGGKQRKVSCGHYRYRHRHFIISNQIGVESKNVYF